MRFHVLMSHLIVLAVIREETKVFLLNKLKLDIDKDNSLDQLKKRTLMGKFANFITRKNRALEVNPTHI